MKRIIAAIIALLSVTALSVGCESKNSSDNKSENKTSSVFDTTSDSKESQNNTSDEKPSEDASENAEKETSADSDKPAETTKDPDSTQPDPLAPKPTTSAQAGEAPTENAANATENPTEPPDRNAYWRNENGNIVFKESENKASDSTLTAAAQELYELACETMWKYTVGCPYELDENDTIETDYNWIFYRVKDEHIKSFSDVADDYYKVFSRRYPNDLNEIYMDGDGAVYAMAGERGMNLYYKESKVISLEKRGSDEIFFKVESYYDGDDFEPDRKWSKTDDFSVVIEDDGSWHIGQFTLPY